MKEKSTLSVNSAGSEEAVLDPSSPLYALRDRCSVCDIDTYIQAVCNDNLRALIISGDAPEDVLLDARAELINEFTELSGNIQSSVLNDTLSEIMALENRITGMMVALRLIEQRDYVGDALHYLAERGLKIKLPVDNDEWHKAAKKVKGTISTLNVKLRQAKKRYEGLIAKSISGKKYTESDFYDQLAVISRYMGFDIPITTTLTKYASYIKDHNRSVEAQLRQQHGRNNK